MVSHPELADRSRRAPSVSSRHTSRSKHHRGRSHAGGSSQQPLNEFPFFVRNGDVEIVIRAEGQEKRYLLHRLILAQCSGFFEAGTSEEWSRAQALQAVPTATPGAEQALTRIGEEEDEPGPAAPQITPAMLSGAPPLKRWRYELDWEHTEEEDEPMLVQKNIDSGLFGSNFAIPPPRPKPPPAHSGGFFRSMLGTQSTANLPSTTPVDAALSIPLIHDYDNLFRIFYNHPPTLHPTDIAAAYSESKSLLFLADMYDALPVVGPRIDHHLLGFSSRLFKQIAKYSPSYLRLGYLARSRIIFTEALIHVVGQWPLALPYVREPGYEMPDAVLELIEDKVDELEELKAKVEAKLFRLTLTTSRGERVNPSNDYLSWLAMSLFRQWLAENTTPPPAPILKSPAHNNPTNPTTAGAPSSSTSATTSSSRIYHLLSSSSTSTYLPHQELKRFLKLHSTSLLSPSTSSRSPSSSGTYSKETLKRLERRVDELKHLARDCVRPLSRNCLELDVRSGEGAGLVGYLTCTKVAEEDLPWD